jgi:hypothetical protein
VAEARGYRSLTEKKEAARYFPPAQQRLPGLLIPLWDVYGQQHAVQLRPDEPRQVDGKIVKYEFPRGTKMTIDVHPHVLANMADPSVPLWIPEGIRKADCLISQGLCAVGLLSTTTWRGTNGKGGKTALPDWHSIALEGREIFIAFDSDCRTNPDLHANTERLGDYLADRGGKLRYLYLPALASGAKQGVDDYIFAGNDVEALMSYVQETWTPLPSSVRKRPKKTLDGVEPCTVEDAVRKFEYWLYLPDHGGVLAALASIAANHLDGDPVYLLEVGGSGSGKTEAVTSCTELPDVYQASTLTEASLLSGSSKKDWAEGARGGLLMEIGDFGFVAMKDFTSILSMSGDRRAGVLSALREIYDGRYTRYVGTDGAQALEWEGKIGFLGGVTQAIDGAHSVMGVMGERFILYRLFVLDQRRIALAALRQDGRKKWMREELSRAVCGVFANGVEKSTALTESDEEKAINLAILVARARSAVMRSGRNREIEIVLEPEAPTRITKALACLWAGADAIGLPHETGWDLVAKVGRDSVPRVRWQVLMALYAEPGWVSSAAVASAARLPTTSTRHSLEELYAHGVVDHKSREEAGGRASLWKLSDWTRPKLDQLNRDSGIENHHIRLYPDESGEADDEGTLDSPDSADHPLSLSNGAPPLYREREREIEAESGESIEGGFSPIDTGFSASSNFSPDSADHPLSISGPGEELPALSWDELSHPTPNRSRGHRKPTPKPAAEANPLPSLDALPAGGGVGTWTPKPTPSTSVPPT